MGKTVTIACQGTESISIDLLEPFQGNLKDLSSENYEKLKKEILELGFSEPISVWRFEGKSYVLGGHQRLRTLKAMRDEGYEVPMIPISLVEAADVKEAKRKILALTSQYGEITSQGLYEFALEAELSASEIEESFRFPEIKMESWKNEFFEDNTVEPGCDEDEVPSSPPAETNVKLGDIYQLGNHRLLCGDSTSIDAIEKLMNGTKADMVFTDPPYGVSYEGGHNKKKRQGIQNDTLEGESLTDLFYGSISCAEMVSHDHAAFYIWYANGKAVETFASFAKLTLKVRAVLCWYKVRSGLGAFMSQYIPNYEPCIYAYKDGCSPQWFGASDEKTVWEQQRVGKNEFHPTQKPVELPERAINNSSKSGQAVLDLFGGSGSTLIACEKTNRKCYMSELDPHYVSVILDRWCKFSGKEAYLLNEDGTRSSWTEVKASVVVV